MVSVFSKVVNSGRELVSPLMVLGALFRFLVFGVLSALPYIIVNLNKVGADLKGESFFRFILSLFFALGKATAKGVFIAGSTLWYSLTNMKDVFGGFRIGLWLYLLIVIPALLLTIYQPIKILTGLLDLGRKEREPNPVLALALAVMVMLMVAAISNWVNKGEIITSGVLEDAADAEEQAAEEEQDSELPLEEETEDGEIINSLDLLYGGG